jgi:uncharacterized protein (TIGR02301 family)
MKRLLTFAVVFGLTMAPQLSLAEQSKGPATKDAPAATEKPTPYDSKLMRLSEILGSLDFIRNLCGSKPEPQWKSLMNALLESDTMGEPQRRARLTAAFNRGYRSFAAIQTSCNMQLRQAADRYRIEGATLATEIVSRFGN